MFAVWERPFFLHQTAVLDFSGTTMASFICTSIFTFCIVFSSLSYVAADSLQARLESVLTPIVNEVS